MASIQEKIYFNVPDDGKCLLWCIFLEYQTKYPELGLPDNFIRLVDELFEKTNKAKYSFNVTTPCEDVDILEITNILRLNINVNYLTRTFEIYQQNFSEYHDRPTIDILLFNGHYYLIINEGFNLSLFNQLINNLLKNIFEIIDTKEHKINYKLYLQEQGLIQNYHSIIEKNKKLLEQLKDDEELARLLAYQKKYLKYKSKYLKLKKSKIL